MDRKRHLGLTEHVEGKSDPGYTLFTPFGHQTTYLVDIEGRVVHRWALPYTAGLWACLLETGNLLMGAATGKSPFGEGGAGGAVIELDWEGNTVWRYDDDAQHHDFSRCPNGNTLVLGREPVPEGLTGAIRGGMPGTEVDGRIWADYLHEVTPSGEVVWEWHAHEALDIEEDVLCALHRRHEWTHANACAVLPDDNVLVSFRVLDTIGIIERATGAFLWKYHDPRLGHQHDPTLLDSGNILVFANGYHAPDPPPVGSRGERDRLGVSDPSLVAVLQLLHRQCPAALQWKHADLRGHDRPHL